MRLPELRRGQSRLQRFLFFLVRSIAGEVPGPMMVMSYRQQYFGKYFSSILQEVMRRCEHWTSGDTEVFAAFVSKQNQCAF